MERRIIALTFVLLVLLSAHGLTVFIHKWPNIIEKTRLQICATDKNLADNA